MSLLLYYSSVPVIDDPLDGVALEAAGLTLSARAEEVLDTLPTYYGADSFSRQVIDSTCRELDRIEAYLNLVRQNSYVHTADDTYGLLAIWERQLGLPVKPEGVTVSDRQGDVLAAYRSRGAASGADWVAVADALIGSAGWEHVENYPNAYDLTVKLPFIFATTTLTGSHTLPMATITVASTTGFPSSGNLRIAGTQNVAYTGTTGTTFTGASGGTGTFPNGTAVQTGAGRAGRIEALLRSITPAHLNLVVTYGDGFIVGESIVGEETL